MTENINEAARAMGRKGGASRSDAKRKAAALNAQKARRALASKERYAAVCEAVGATPDWNVEKPRRTLHTIVAPTNYRPKPQPAPADELSQEATPNDFTVEVWPPSRKPRALA